MGEINRLPWSINYKCVEFQYKLQEHFFSEKGPNHSRRIKQRKRI